MKYLLMMIMAFGTLAVNAQQDTVKATAVINEATVYYGYGAELTHSARLTVTKNTRYIIIDRVSTQMDLNSLQISCPENISLLSQQFSVYEPPAKPFVESALSKKIRDTIKTVNTQIAVITNKIDIDETVLNKTDKLIESTIATSGNKTALTAEVLKLIEFYNKTIEKNKQAIFEHRQELLLLQDQISGLNERLILANKPPEPGNEGADKAYGRITLQVICRTDEAADIALSYYTDHAGWQPLYDIRVNSKTNTLKLVYKAAVTQNTGLSWKKTKLTLSTGTPNFTTAAPILNPLYLQLYVPQLYNNLDYDKKELSAVTITNNIHALGYSSTKTNADYLVNENINPSTIEQFTKLKQGLLNTSFEIDLPYDIESNGLPHSINIKEQELPSILKNYAVPKLDGDAYLLAEIADWQNLDLIPGNANIIMDDTYIGRSFIDPNSTADTLNLSLGKDRRVAVKRSVVKDATSSKIKDAFIKQTFTYELTVKNNKITDVDMMLKDQYPLSNVKEVETELTDAGGALVNAEIGVLTWKINLKPGESKKFRFTYTVKYPKDKKIANLR